MYWLHVFSILTFINIRQATIFSDSYGLSKKDTLPSLESLKELANAPPGDRRISLCDVKLERSDCIVNITSTSLPCPVNKILEHLFTKIDMNKISGGFVNEELSLISLEFDFDKKGGRCSHERGSVELNVNSTGRHIRLIERSFLPLKVVLIQATWPLHISILRAVDIEINGIFVSDNLNGFSRIPTYEGVIIEMRKPKGLTIYEMKTTKSQNIQLQHLIKDFNIEIEMLTHDLTLKTQTELSLMKLVFADASLVGYIEPGIMLEIQLTGKHSGSLAFTNSQQVYVVIQKYKLQLKPSIVVFGKIHNKGKIDVDLLKLSSVTTIPSFTFLSYIQEYLLVVASDKFNVVNIKQAREESDDYTCKECRLHFLPGFNAMFRIPDVLNFLRVDSAAANKTSVKKTIVVRPDRSENTKLTTPDMTKSPDMSNTAERTSFKKTVVVRPYKVNNSTSTFDMVRSRSDHIKRKDAITHHLDLRRKRLEEYMAKLKRDRVPHRYARVNTQIKKHRSRRDNDLKDVLLNSTEHFNGNDSLIEFDDSFLMDNFNPFPRTTFPKTTTNSKQQQQHAKSSTENSTITTANDNNSNKTVTNTIDLQIHTDQNITTTINNNNNSTQSNMNNNSNSTDSSPVSNTTSISNQTLKSNLTESKSVNLTLPANDTNSDSALLPDVSPSTLSILSSNKTVYDSFDGNSFSFHDINSLTNEKQTLEPKIKIPSTRQKNIKNLIVYAGISDKELNFIFPQSTEGSLENIVRFVSTSLEEKPKCNLFNNSEVKFSLSEIHISDEKLRISLNTTQAHEVIPELLSIKRYMGVELIVPVENDNSFDYENVMVSGSGKYKILEEEYTSQIVQDQHDCFLNGKLPLPTIKNISEYFDAELLSSDATKTLRNIGPMNVEDLNVTIGMGTSRILKLKGVTQKFGKIRFNVFLSIWSDIGSKKRRMAVAFTSKYVSFDRVFHLVFGKNLLLPPWLILEDAAVSFSASGIKSTTFDDKVLQNLPTNAGISFSGKLLRPIQCETYLTNDRFCQYFHAKLPNPIQLKGTVTKDKLSISGKASTSMMISQEVIMVEPAVIVKYEDSRYELYIAGTVIVEINDMKFKLSGRISRHGSGFVLLQVASPSSRNLFNTSLIHFHPFLGIAQLSKRTDFACVLELHPSRVTVGSNNQTLRLTNPSGRIIPSDPTANYIHGVVKDLSLQTLFEVLNVQGDVMKNSLLKDLKFEEFTRVVYAETLKVTQYDFMAEDVLPGLTFYGETLLEEYKAKTVVNVDNANIVKLTIDWPMLNMSRGMIFFRKKKDDMTSGPTLTVTTAFNSKDPAKIVMRAYVQALGMEREQAEIRLEKRNEGVEYLFTMKGKIFNEIEMLLAYRGFETANLGFRVKGHIPNLADLKVALRLHLRKIFNDFTTLYAKEKKENEKNTHDIDSLIHELGATVELNVKGKLKDLIIQLEDVEESIKEFVKGIDVECVEECNKPVEIQTLQDLDINDIELKNIHIQRIAPRWAMNCSCVAGCEVKKGISHKKAAESLSKARNLYPLYEKQKQVVGKLEGYLKVAEKIKDTALKAKAYFLKHSDKAKQEKGTSQDADVKNQVIEKFISWNVKMNWFDVLSVEIPEVDTVSLRGKLPCFKTKLKFLLFAEEKETTQELCINGEFLHNLGQQAFRTVFSKADVVSLTQHFDRVKSFYARIRQRRQELVDVIHHDDATDGNIDSDLTKFAEMGKRDEVFKPLLKTTPYKEDLYDKRFKSLILTVLPQYSVHNFKTAVVMNQKSPWAIFKSIQVKRTSLARKTRSAAGNNATLSNEDSDCSTVNGVVSKYSHITNALVDLVESYNQGRLAFAETRDQLVDSLHTLDSTITNEANRTYYTKGELKDMIYWSVRVWKGVEDWVQASTRQFEDHNRNAITQFTDQLNDVFSGEHASTAAGFVQKLSHIGAVAMKRMSVASSPIVKKTVAMQPDDLVQNVALSISQFLTAKDMTLDEATHKVPALKTAVYTLVSHVPPCDPAPIQQPQISATATQTLQNPMDTSNTMLMNEPGAAAGAVRDSSSATVVQQQQTPGTIMTENSGSITMDGSPQILTEPSNNEQMPANENEATVITTDGSREVIDANSASTTNDNPMIG